MTNHITDKDIKRYRKTIAVDFDRVIHKYREGWKDGTIYDEPVDGAIEAIKQLQEDGFHVVIMTAKTPQGGGRNEKIREWLKSYGLDLEVTNTKPPALAYIDDRAIRFTNWRDILSYFL